MIPRRIRGGGFVGMPSSLCVRNMDGEVHYHVPAHKMRQQKLLCKGDVLVQGELVLQGNVKTICNLGILSMSGFFTAFQSVCRSAILWVHDRAAGCPNISSLFLNSTPHFCRGLLVRLFSRSFFITIFRPPIPKIREVGAAQKCVSLGLGNL